MRALRNSTREILCAVAALVIVHSSGCNGSIGPTVDRPDTDVLDRPNGCTPEVVFARNGCTASGCHGATFRGGLDLVSSNVEERLVDVRSTTQACSGRLLVSSEAPESSLLLQVLDHNWAASADACTMAMPLGGAAMSADDVACITAWVQEISKDSIGPPDYTGEFEPLSAEAYVPKVKTLLTGEAVAESELEQVTARPAELESLVRTWVRSPAFATKLERFFEVTLQTQTEASLRPFLNLTLTGRDFALQKLMAGSVRRTAVDIVQRHAPLTTLVTTRTFMMNTALLTLVAYLDQPVRFRNGLNHTVERGTAVKPIAESIDSRTWVFPEQTEACTTNKLHEDELLQAFFGSLNCRGGVPNVQLSEGRPLSAADFEDWRPVTFTDSSEPTRWYDLVTLRSATTLGVRNPRVGFFTTPAFQMNWLTNDDNSYRVTINQTLIAALDATFFAGDTTTPLLPSGVDEAHAAPSTECYGCHKHMDPMRGYFRTTTHSTYAYASDPTPAAFSFLGVAIDGGDIDAFASTIATHPRFAMAWTQKLCMWATAHRCAEDDPETQRIAALFAASGFDFEELVVALFTSPLVTESAFVDTFAHQQTFVSVARRDHICSILRARAGVAGICEVRSVANALAFVPVDNYARGATDLVQATTTSPFHSAASDRLCLAVAPLVVGTGKTFDPRDPAFAERLTSEFLGMPANHSRHATVAAALADHFDAARATGANVSISGQSTFSAACVSADITALGI